ncbi:TIGR03899 family protein [Thalassotalea piscium]|uniref:Putative repeat protein (TIGR03899 family) n=1 Tax=Thalassotalea piscium TaxID=1230533 RepID=A0A7X0TUC5_9GAMM|nr:TIGR03899 family protein [Thalassotalea piscium]MBB6544217.1 putative repeat protein (TIGR03899 family) [Thalassotalea piscium]
MKITTTSVNPVAKTTEINKPPVVSTEETSNSASNKSSKSGASSQLQLLNLAKQFILDGALISASKQCPLEERTQKRDRYIRFRKQQNLEVIIQKAISYCSDKEITDRADVDWFNSFTEFAEGISNPTMQELWAKILAYEVTRPGSFSLKTLQAFRTMSMGEAKLFAKACALALKDSTRKNLRIISGSSQLPGMFNFFSKKRLQKINLGKFGLSYAELLTLADNHLIFIQETESSPIALGESIHFYCNNSPMILSPIKHNCLLSFYKFTPIGAELANLISDSVDESYLELVKDTLSSHFVIN